jgi:hypothetical protein
LLADGEKIHRSLHDHLTAQSRKLGLTSFDWHYAAIDLEPFRQRMPRGSHQDAWRVLSCYRMFLVILEKVPWQWELIRDFSANFMDWLSDLEAEPLPWVSLLEPAWLIDTGVDCPSRRE